MNLANEAPITVTVLPKTKSDQGAPAGPLLELARMAGKYATGIVSRSGVQHLLGHQFVPYALDAGSSAHLSSRCRHAPRDWAASLDQATLLDLPEPICPNCLENSLTIDITGPLGHLHAAMDFDDLAAELAAGRTDGGSWLDAQRHDRGQMLLDRLTAATPADTILVDTAVFADIAGSWPQTPNTAVGRCGTATAAEVTLYAMHAAGTTQSQVRPFRGRWRGDVNTALRALARTETFDPDNAFFDAVAQWLVRGARPGEIARSIATGRYWRDEPGRAPFAQHIHDATLRFIDQLAEAVERERGIRTKVVVVRRSDYGGEGAVVDAVLDNYVAGVTGRWRLLVVDQHTEDALRAVDTHDMIPLGAGVSAVRVLPLVEVLEPVLCKTSARYRRRHVATLHIDAAKDYPCEDRVAIAQFELTVAQFLAGYY